MNKKYRKPNEIIIKGIKLSEILDEHKNWLKTGQKKGSRANLSNEDLSNLKINNENLSYIILKGANLFDSNLIGVNFKYADFSYAKLSGSNLQKSDFSNSKLCHTRLTKSNLFKANFSWTNLSYARLSGVYLYEANLSASIMKRTYLYEADLTKSKIVESYLEDVNFQGANLTDVDFSRSRFNGSIFSNTNLSNVNFSNLSLRGLEMFYSKLPNANLSNTDLSATKLIDVDLTGACLDSTNLRNSILGNIVLTGAIFKDVATHNWEIKNIICDFIFFDLNRKKLYPKDRIFEKGEFEILYRTIPTIELVFDNGYDLLDHLVAPFLENYMSSKGKGQNLVFISINNEGIFPSIKYEVPPNTNMESVLKTVKKEYKKLKKDNRFLKAALMKALENGRINFTGEVRNVALPRSTFIDKSVNITSNIESFLTQLETAPEFMEAKNQIHKAKTKKVLFNCLKQIKEGALKEGGKTLMSSTIEKAIEIAPTLKLIGQELLKDFV